jgi:trimeric autotransporter adhesin
MASANLGTNSAAFGLATIASASESFAAGNQAKATGVASTAFGSLTSASGVNSFAAGNKSVASALNSIAMGDEAKATSKGAVALGVATASGEFAFAAGNIAIASGFKAVALGNSTASSINSFAAAQGKALAQSAVALNGHATGIASFATNDGYATGSRSIAMGPRASTNEKTGSMVVTDNVNTNMVNAASDNQFVARFNRFWFGRETNVTSTPGYLIETSVGARLSNGGTWETVSDSTKKTAFTPVDAEDVLVKLAGIGMQTWQYSAESDSVRHMGPTAQAFRAAFGLGASERSIATVDADGVALVAAQALEKRTRGLRAETAALRAENAQLSERLAQLEALVARLTATPRER